MDSYRADKMSKINDQIISLSRAIDEINDYEASNDFDIRERHIVANIRVRDWLDEDDVLNYVKDRNLTQAEIEDLLSEFNDSRLDSITSHTGEWEIRYAKEMLEDRVHINNLDERAFDYARFLRGEKPKNDYYVKQFELFSKRKNNSYKQYKAFIQRTNKFDYEEANRLDSFTPEVWQYGRSGGWLSVCKADELENSYLEWEGITEENIDEILEGCDKRAVLKEMKESIAGWEFTFASIKHYVDLFEDNAKHFIECVRENMKSEIDEYLDGNLKTNCTIKIIKEFVRTSLGVTVPLKEFMDSYSELMNELNNHKPGEKFEFNRKVGNYTVENVTIDEDDVIIKAGCHRFSLNQIKEVVGQTL